MSKKQKRVALIIPEEKYDELVSALISHEVNTGKSISMNKFLNQLIEEHIEHLKAAKNIE